MVPPAVTRVGLPPVATRYVALVDAPSTTTVNENGPPGASIRSVPEYPPTSVGLARKVKFKLWPEAKVAGRNGRSRISKGPPETSAERTMAGPLPMLVTEMLACEVAPGAAVGSSMLPLGDNDRELRSGSME